MSKFSVVLASNACRHGKKKKANTALLAIREPELSIGRKVWSVGDLLLLFGGLCFVLPPMIQVARDNWSTEQGGHGPIVLGTGLWLLYREYQAAKDSRQSGNWLLSVIAVAVLLAVYVIAGITGILEIQVLAMYASVVIVAYQLLGARVIKQLWFPLIYLAFALPPPDSVVVFITQPVKILISETAVSLLHSVGYPVGSSGVVIQIAQYELLVAAACAGLNSLISLSAICMFYAYLRHRNDVKALLLLAMLTVPVAIFSNFVRVIILILLTYHVSESAAQGFLHDFAGLLTFAAALGTMMAVESLYSRIASKRKAQSPA